MPRGHKTPGTLVAEVKMMRMSHPGALLIVEGGDDLRFWQPRCHKDCELVLGENKHNVVEAFLRLDTQQFNGALGIVDSDYDRLTGVSYGTANLAATDAHDLECLLCRSSALEAVLVEFGDRAKIKRFEDAAAADVRQCLLRRGLVFGHLRWAALRHGDTGGLSEIRIGRFVDQETWDVDEEGLFGTVPTASPDNATTWMKRVAGLPSADPWQVVRGHDLVDILRIGLRRVLGNIGPQVGRKEIARILRQAMPKADLSETGLYADIRDWETTNVPYVVIRN